MKRVISCGLMVSVLFLFYSCNTPGVKSGNISGVEERIEQDMDGTISLQLDDATCYNDDGDPSSNTAEWIFQVKESGRYEVWVTSHTKDTMDLQYPGSVKVNLLDERLEAKPIGNNIVTDAKDVVYPYFRADSYMGTFYFDEPGEYVIQLINEKATHQADNLSQSDSEHTVLKSLILKPMVH